MYCPKCRAEYRPGLVMCATCDVPLVDKLQPRKVELPVIQPKEEEVVGIDLSKEMEGREWDQNCPACGEGLVEGVRECPACGLTTVYHHEEAVAEKSAHQGKVVAWEKSQWGRSIPIFLLIIGGGLLFMGWSEKIPFLMVIGGVIATLSLFIMARR